MTLLSCETVFGATALIAVVICFVTYVNQIKNVGADSCRNEISKSVASLVSPLVASHLQAAGLRSTEYNSIDSKDVSDALKNVEMALTSERMSFTLTTTEGVILGTTEFDTADDVKRPLPHNLDEELCSDLKVAASRSEGMQIAQDSKAAIHAVPVPHYRDLILCVSHR